MIDRRTLLAGAGSSAMCLAGCVGGVPTDDGVQHSDDEPEVSIETTKSTCGGLEDDWAVAGLNDERVSLDGITPAPNPCHEATVAAIDVVDEVLEVDIAVTSTLEDDTECIECVGAIGYTATIKSLTDAVEAVRIDHIEGDTHDIAPYSIGADPRVITSTIETIDAGPPEEDDVDVLSTGPVITIGGRIPAPNPCHKAVLSDTEIVDGNLKVRIHVREDISDDGACSQVMSHVTYRVNIELDGPPHIDTIVVSHADESTHTITDEEKD